MSIEAFLDAFSYIIQLVSFITTEQLIPAILGGCVNPTGSYLLLGTCLAYHFEACSCLALWEDYPECAWY